MKTQQSLDTVWITGAGGLIGRCLVGNRITQSTKFRVVPLNRQLLELTDFAAVTRRFREERPSLVIHCAALTRTPECQANPALAHKLNVEVTAHLAGLASEGRFIFFSTDLVFDGRKGNYVETDPVNPQSVYAETKAKAEGIVVANPRHTAIRASLTSGASSKGAGTYNELYQEAWKRGETLKLFTDEFRCPMPASVTARAVWEMAALELAGFYHLAGSERLSRAQIGQLAAERHPESNPRIELCSLRDYKGPPRTPDSSLDCSKVQKHLSFKLPGLTQYLRDHPDEPF